jgi:hypothetical protein
MKQSSHINQCHSLHKFFFSAIWILDLLHYIPPKLLLCGLRHEPPILDGDGDIVSNLKSASAFERFPCFRWFNFHCFIQLNPTPYPVDPLCGKVNHYFWFHFSSYYLIWFHYSLIYNVPLKFSSIIVPCPRN